MDAAPRTETELRRTVHRLMLETVPSQHAQLTIGTLRRLLLPKVPGIAEEALCCRITAIAQEPASGFILSSYGKIRRRLTPANIYATHRDMKQHLDASTLRSPSGRPLIQSRVFVESMKTLLLATSDAKIAAIIKQFYNGVSELFGEQWVEELVRVGGKAICCRSLQDLPDKASIVARNRDLIAALEEGSTVVPFPPLAPTPCNLTLQYPHSAELRPILHRLMLETVPHIHSILSRSALLRVLSLKVPNTDQVVLRSIVTSVIEGPESGFILDAQGRIQRCLTPAEIYVMHGEMKQHLAASALRSGRPMVECRVFLESMQTLVLTTSVKRATRLGAQFYKGVSELFGERWVPKQIKVGGTTTHGRSLQNLPDKASIVARNRDLIAALEKGITAVPFPPPAPLPADAPAVAAPAVQRRGRGVAPKRQREAGPSDTEGVVPPTRSL